MHSAVDYQSPSTHTYFLLLLCRFFSLLIDFTPSQFPFGFTFSCRSLVSALSSSEVCLSFSVMCFDFQSMVKTVRTSTCLVSHLQEACGWDPSPLRIICKVWHRMTLLILKDYFLMEQFVTGKVYTVCLCTLCISSCALHFFASADLLVCTWLCVGVKTLKYWSSVIE